MWYSELYRRHLCDMHIDDWSDEFLSEFSPEEYVGNLMRANINYAMIYFQSHVGLCYWPTKTGVMHKSFEKDPEKMKRLVDLCHQNNIKVMGYYSLIYNTREHDRHLEWRHKQENGQSNRENRTAQASLDPASFAGWSRYGHCCPNNEGYRAFVNAQIDEMVEFFHPDGLFFDMPFWPGTCYCDVCRKRYMLETGKRIPSEKADINSPEVKEFMQYKYAWMGEFVQGVTDHVKSIDKDIAVEHNFASAIASGSGCGCGEEVAAACDFAGGDLYGDLYNQSITCKFMRAMSNNQPFEYMFSRCKPGLRSHTMTKTPEQMKTSLAITMAHHGATLVIDAIDPIGTLDKRVYTQLGTVFNFQKQYEKYFTGTPHTDVGIYYGIRSKNNIPNDTVNGKIASVGALKAMIKQHMLCDVIGNQPLEKFGCIIAPMLTDSEIASDRLVDYVANGGSLYISGGETPALIETLTGGKILGRSEYNRIYVAPSEGNEELFGGFNKKYPLSYEHTFTYFEPAKNSEILATVTVPYTKPEELRFASIHCNPPGIATEYPAVAFNRYGKGKVLYSAVPIETEEYEEYGAILTNLIKKYLGAEQSLISDAPTSVEITRHDGDDFVTLAMAVLDERNISLPILPFKVRVKTKKAPRKVVLLPEETDVAFEYSDGFVTFEARMLHIFDMYEILF